MWQTELKQYIANVSKMGFPEAKIRDVLRGAGWKDDQINGGFKAIKLMTIINAPAIALDLEKIAKVQRTFHDDLKKVKSQEKTVISRHSEEVGDRRISENQAKYRILRKLRMTNKKLSNPKLIKETYEHDYFLPEAHDYYLAPSSARQPAALLAGASAPAPLMLASPSYLTIWWRKIQFWTEYFFTSLEGALVILGKTALLPIVIISFIVTAITVSIKSVAAKNLK